MLKQFELRRCGGVQVSFGKYIHAFSKLLDRQIRLLENPSWLQIFMNAAVRKERAYTFSELNQMSKSTRGPGGIATQDLMALIEQKIFFRGYRLECPRCDLSDWYSINDIADEVRCIGCQERFQMPVEAHFAYRLNRIAAEALKNGGLTVLLVGVYAGRALDCRQDMEWLAGMELTTHNRKLEADVVVRCGEDLYCYECKDAIYDKDKLLEQLRRLKFFADAINATGGFATLAATIPDEVTAFCAENGIRVADAGRPGTGLIRGDRHLYASQFL